MRSLSCQDMTSGPLGKQILLFSLPLICSKLFGYPVDKPVY